MSFPYVLDPDPRPSLGLIVLQSDETTESDFARLFAGHRLLVSRVPSGLAVTKETLTAMANDLPAAAALFPRAARFKAVGYGCTSGATLIGPERVQSLVQSGCETEAVTNPLTAAFAAFKALDLQRVGILSPYIGPVAQELKATFEAGGITVPATLSFGEETEENVARIAHKSILTAARALHSQDKMDALFLSCTNLRALDVIDTLEAELNCPVLCSNQVLGWHMARLSGVTCQGVGRLFQV